jgi:hypothetical protein
VAGLDSITLLFVVAHFAGLMWAYGHLQTIQSAERKYEAATAIYNSKAEKVSTDNAKIAEAAREIATQETRRAKIENDTAYQQRKAAERGAQIQPRRPGSQSLGASLSTSQVQLERPKPPEETSAHFLGEWDWLIRVFNFGELMLAAVTLVFIRNQSAKTNSPAENSFTPGNFFPTGVYRSPISARRGNFTPKSDNERQSLSLSQKSERLSLSDPDRKDALKRLREHLKQIAFYHPNRWFKADLVRGGVTIRLFERQHGHEIALSQTTQSDKLLAAVERPDFQERLIGELRHQGFEI